MAKTHQNITDPFLRYCYAKELNEARIGMRGDTDPCFKHGVLFGIESAFWSQQKILMQMGTEIPIPIPEYRPIDNILHKAKK